MTTEYARPSRSQDALLELIQRKPPPKIDGLVHLANDQRQQFTNDERRRMFQSPEGQLLARAMTRCEGHEKAIREARADWLQHRDNKTKLSKMEHERNKYVECLTYATCPTSWQPYSQCWSHLATQLNREQLQQLQALGPQVACQYERQALELCVGNVVAGAVRAAVPSEECDWP